MRWQSTARLALPPAALAIPRLGCVNIHASLLPRWRGAAPIHRAIEAGDAETGVTIMQMDAGLDTGDMLLRESLAIGGDTTARLHDRLAALGGRMIVDALHRAEAGTLRSEPQPSEGVTYAHKVEKAEAQVDWAQDAATIVRRVASLRSSREGVSRECDRLDLRVRELGVRLFTL